MEILEILLGAVVLVLGVFSLTWIGYQAIQAGMGRWWK